MATDDPDRGAPPESPSTPAPSEPAPAESTSTPAASSPSSTSARRAETPAVPSSPLLKSGEDPFAQDPSWRDRAWYVFWYFLLPAGLAIALVQGLANVGVLEEAA